MSARDFTSMRTTSPRAGAAKSRTRRASIKRRNIIWSLLGLPKNILTFMASPRSAAAVILVREEPDLEVFWVRRAPHMMFQGGFYAFPGGQLDPNEDAKVCAARELFEEVGVRVEPSTLIDVGRWVTPAFAPRRFDTCFFLANCPEGQDAGVATEEHDIGEWIQPHDAVARWMEGRILMAPPVLHALRCLSQGLDGIEVMMKSVPWAHGETIPEIEMRPGIVLVPV